MLVKFEDIFLDLERIVAVGAVETYYTGKTSSDWMYRFTICLEGNSIDVGKPQPANFGREGYDREKYRNEVEEVRKGLVLAVNDLAVAKINNLTNAMTKTGDKWMCRRCSCNNSVIHKFCGRCGMKYES